MRIIDTHCHLGHAEFADDIEEVLTRAQAKDIVAIGSAVTASTWTRVVDIAGKYSNVYASIGLDPMLAEYHNEAAEAIERFKENLVAIGEIGIDHYRERNHGKRVLQEIAFRKLIKKAQELTLPIQVHSRSAGRKALEILASEDAELVHMHAFDGKASLARAASRDLGYYFSIPTSVVRSPQKRKLVKAVAIERLLLETDSPVLGPEKAIRNEPSNIQVALRETAQILNMEEEELGETILENTLRLYTRIQPQ
jgi:TatD DNase family protein